MRKYHVRTTKLGDGYLAKCEPSALLGYGKDPATAAGRVLVALALMLVGERLAVDERKRVTVQIDHG